MPLATGRPPRPRTTGDPSGRPRVLYVTHRVPYPPDKGDRIRNYHVLRQLCEQAEVWLAALSDEQVSPETQQELTHRCHKVSLIPVSGKKRWLRAGLSLMKGRSLSEGAFTESALRQQLRQWLQTNHFNAAIVSASSLAGYLRQDGWENVPGFVDVVDVDSQKWFDYPAATPVPKRWLYQLEGRRVRKCEKALSSWAAACSIVSPHEAQVFESFAGVGTATVATNGVDLDYFTPQTVKESPACAFVGALDYRPNVDAALWFANTIWPQIREKQTNAELHLIGRKPTAEVQALASIPGVVVVGQVPDVRPHVASASVVVVPMRLSRGLQNKVLEAMAMAKAVVASPPALAALQTTDGLNVLRAENTQDWVKTVVELLNDSGLRADLGREARAYVEQFHHWETCLQPLMSLIAEACQPVPGRQP